MRFNFFTKKSKVTVNHEGAKAFVLTPELELYAAVVTASLSDQFYEKSGERVERIRTLIGRTKPAFVVRLAIYTREQMHLRSIPLVLAVELAKIHNGDNLVATLCGRVVQRADEIAELLAYYALANGRKELKQLNRLSKQLQKGLGMAFNKFDEYQFAKYNRDAAVKLRDALFLVHPKAKDANQQMIFDKIVQGKLQTPYTWETELSALGQQAYANATEKQLFLKAKWEELIFSNKLGYMAMLRNLRNILEAEVSKEALDKVCSIISNRDAVARSKQLPFRFLAAYRELQALKNGRTGLVLDALETAVLHSAANIAGYDEDTRVVIAADVSGSMQRPISLRSKIQSYDIGLMLAMLLQSRCKHVITGMFGERWKIINVPKSNILANVDTYHRREGEVGYATNGHLVIEDLLERKAIVDKVMIFTDCQLWNTNHDKFMVDVWKQYKQIAPAAKLYLFDLAGYGNTPLSVLREDVFLVAGWSDKVFDVLAAIDKGQDALQVIEQIEID
ncbi:TROVE domain-containing protein [Chitinophagaceae bacterium MMS25-I14]